MFSLFLIYLNFHAKNNIFLVFKDLNFYVIFPVLIYLNFRDIFLGKCYNVPEDFLVHQERQSKATEETSSHIEVKKGQLKKLDPESIHNIPAVLHYEQKQALLHEMLRKDRGMEMIEEEESLDEDESQNPHFFYSNAPIMEFNINGESGSVGQTPRK